MANGKYSENYASFWIAHNAMLAFLKTWERQNKWCTSFEELANPIREGKRLYSPDFGWMYVWKPIPFWEVGRGPGVRNGDGCMFEMGREKRSSLPETSSCRFVVKIWVRFSEIKGAEGQVKIFMQTTVENPLLWPLKASSVRYARRKLECFPDTHNWTQSRGQS